VLTIQLRTSSSAACASQMSEGMRLRRAVNHRPRKYLILLILWLWLAALDDFRNWFQLGLEARERT
jgi:hypothetical protein